MPEKLRSVAAFVLVLSVLAVGAAQEPPTAQQVVERFTEALSAGSTASAFGFLALSGAWSEHDLYWRTATGRDLQIRAYELVRAGVRLETDVVAVVGDGQVVITQERMWGDFVPEEMAPLRSTTVYVVESGWLVGITRVLSAEQRDELTMAALADSTWSDATNTERYRFGADGTIRSFLNLLDQRASRHTFSGTFEIVRGVMTWVADADSRVCHPGTRLVMRGRLIDQDTWQGFVLTPETDCGYFLDLILTEASITTHRLPDE